MKIFKIQDRREYFDIQIERSKVKFNFCKVSVKDTELFKKILDENNLNEGPILCLGTRNGREIDLFRNTFFGNSFLNVLIKK